MTTDVTDLALSVEASPRACICARANAPFHVVRDMQRTVAMTITCLIAALAIFAAERRGHL